MSKVDSPRMTLSFYSKLGSYSDFFKEFDSVIDIINDAEKVSNVNIVIDLQSWLTTFYNREILSDMEDNPLIKESNYFTSVIVSGLIYYYHLFKAKLNFPEEDFSIFLIDDREYSNQTENNYDNYSNSRRDKWEDKESFDELFETLDKAVDTCHRIIKFLPSIFSVRSDDVPFNGIALAIHDLDPDSFNIVITGDVADTGIMVDTDRMIISPFNGYKFTYRQDNLLKNLKLDESFTKNGLSKSDLPTVLAMSNIPKRVQSGLAPRMGLKTAANKLKKLYEDNPEFNIGDLTGTAEDVERVIANELAISPTLLRIRYPAEMIDLKINYNTIPISRKALVTLNKEKFRTYPINFRYISAVK